jgi:hypothetical protein
MSFVMTKMLSLVPMELVVLQVCIELVVRVFSAVELSSSPVINPHVPQAEHPLWHLETFLKLSNNGTDQTVNNFVPWMTVRHRPTPSSCLSIDPNFCFRAATLFWLVHHSC